MILAALHLKVTGLNWISPSKYLVGLESDIILCCGVVRQVRLELTASTLGRWRSTTELLAQCGCYFKLAGPQGIEPRATEPESVVLPLHQSPRGRAG